MTNQPVARTFVALELALLVIGSLRPVVDKIRRILDREMAMLWKLTH